MTQSRKLTPLEEACNQLSLTGDNLEKIMSSLTEFGLEGIALKLDTIYFNIGDINHKLRKLTQIKGE